MQVLNIQNVAMVRRMEFNADKFSVEMGYGIALRDGLIAIHVNNQANLNPDWLYALLKFDHPALVERLQAIDNEIIKYVKSKTGYSLSFDDAKANYQELFQE